jgi:ERCC4-type nuclease
VVDVNIIIDTREHKDKISHITNYFDTHNIGWYRSKLIVADYQNPLNPTIVIDRKNGLQEVCGNVTMQHERFVRELELARDLGYKMIVLVEEPTVKQLVDVCSWYNWRRKKNPRAINGKTLYKIMKTMQDKYGIEWMFTTKEKCGERIIELLKGG